ncbi:hypothetical protein HY546_00845 [archaeon]|nr:hypothetical protein [archaeon]
MEFWNEEATDKSWRVLVEFKKNFDFVLIGGWAVYLYTRALKSRDIDCIVDFDTLGSLKAQLVLTKNERLKKYDAVIDGISIDLYVPYYSSFAIPSEEIMKRTAMVEGFKLPKMGVLVALKQQAELNRKNVLKGQKDRIDILSLISRDELNTEDYYSLLREFKLDGYWERLKQIIKTSTDEYAYLGAQTPPQTKKLKQKLLSKLES